MHKRLQQAHEVARRAASDAQNYRNHHNYHAINGIYNQQGLHLDAPNPLGAGGYGVGLGGGLGVGLGGVAPYGGIGALGALGGNIGGLGAIGGQLGGGNLVLI